MHGQRVWPVAEWSTSRLSRRLDGRTLMHPQSRHVRMGFCLPWHRSRNMKRLMIDRISEASDHGFPGRSWSGLP